MVVIAGGGFAGLEAAIQIKTLRPACAVVLISPSPNLVYKPWLIYVPAGRRRLAETCLPLAPMAARVFEAAPGLPDPELENAAREHAD